LEQNTESKNFLKDSTNEKGYLAPTSFGKSSLIIDYIKQLSTDNLKIAIIVPTKSLLMQTYHMIRDAQLDKKIILHDEMYNSENEFIAIFTQERALRLISRVGLFYDILIIDEAHNLLKKDSGSRNILLSRLISLNKSLNPIQKVIYLSPLIDNIKNLRIDNSQNIKSHKIKFNVKEPEIFEHTMDGTVFQFNRFVGQFYQIDKNISKNDYIIKNSKHKNFLYESSPVNIEKLALKLSNILPSDNTKDAEILKIQEILRKVVHKDFYAIKYLSYGIIYLHGQIPDIVKEYLESKFKKLGCIKYIVANTVILEGMNLPIDNLFICNTHRLHGKELINLIGRVNRLNTIFTGTEINFNKLLPSVHFMNRKVYEGIHNKKIHELRSRVFVDVVKNPMLEEFDFKNLKISKSKEEIEKKKIEIIQENEKFVTMIPTNDYDKVKYSFIESGILGFYEDSDDVIRKFILRKNNIINNDFPDWDTIRIVDKLEHLFINDLDVKDFELSRLEYFEARNYYDNYINHSRKKSFNERVESQFEYFKTRSESNNSEERLFYMGKTYGQIPKYSEKHPESKSPVYVDLAKKNDTEKVNLAIVKLKMEDDFISFKINKFIKVLYDYKLISKNEYNQFIYGTTDPQKINLTKYGLNISLITRLEDANQLKNLMFDKYNNLKANLQFNEFLNKINDFDKFELTRYVLC
jgi:superfamily II DNA or RNA helicase